MTEVESVPRAKQDIVENENHIASNGKDSEEHVEVKKRVGEREQNENLGDKTSVREEKHKDWPEAPPPTKNPWTRHMKKNEEKGMQSKLLSHVLVPVTVIFEPFCVFFFFRRARKTCCCES